MIYICIEKSLWSDHTSMPNLSQLDSFFTNVSEDYKMLPFIFIIKIISLILSCDNSESE